MLVKYTKHHFLLDLRDHRTTSKSRDRHVTVINYFNAYSAVENFIRAKYERKQYMNKSRGSVPVTKETKSSSKPPEQASRLSAAPSSSSSRGTSPTTQAVERPSSTSTGSNTVPRAKPRKQPQQREQV